MRGHDMVLLAPSVYRVLYFMKTIFVYFIFLNTELFNNCLKTSFVTVDILILVGLYWLILILDSKDKMKFWNIIYLSQKVYVIDN